jgi:hypothetical protein
MPLTPKGSKILAAIQDRAVRDYLATRASVLLSGQSGRVLEDAEKTLADCELLIRLKQGGCKKTARVAAQHLPRYNLLKESFLMFIAFQKLFTGLDDYGETYLAYLVKTEAEPKNVIDQIRRALKPAGWQPPETT